MNTVATEMKTYILSIPTEIHKKISILAVKNKKTRTEFISSYINMYFTKKYEEINFLHIKKYGLEKYSISKQEQNRKTVRIYLCPENFAKIKESCINHEIYVTWLMRYLLENLINELDGE